MDIGSILLILALAVLAGIFISQPFMKQAAEGDQSPHDKTEKRRSALLAERERLLNALAELDNDYALGKVPAEDYPTQRRVLLQAGAAVLSEMDNLKMPV